MIKGLITFITKLLRTQAVSSAAYALMLVFAITLVGVLTVLGDKAADVIFLHKDEVVQFNTKMASSDNTPPTISDIADATIGLNETFGPTAFTISDLETNEALLYVSAVSSNQSVIPDSNISLSGSHKNREIYALPELNQSGDVTITVTVTDGALSAQDSFVLTVDDTLSNCNDNMVAGERCLEDGDEVVFVSIYDPGDGWPRRLLAWPCDLGMTWDGSGCTGTRTEHIWNNGNTSGYTDIATSHTDGHFNTDLLVTSDSDSVAIGTQPHQSADACRALGAAWYLPATAEMIEIKNAWGQGSFDGTLSIGVYWASTQWDQVEARYISPDPPWAIGASEKDNDFYIRCTRQPSDTAPSITSIGDAGSSVGLTYGPVNFIIDDLQTAPSSLSVTAVSSNQSVVADGAIVLGGSDGDRHLTFTSSAVGSTDITVTVDDGFFASESVFTVTIYALPDCSPALDTGTSCIYNAEEVVFVENYDPGDGWGRMFMAKQCDLGMRWTGAGCTETRISYPWNNGNSSGHTNVGTNATDGSYNTTLLIGADSDTGTLGTQPHQAAEACRALGAQWYLPSTSELIAIKDAYGVGDFEGTLSTGVYWASSQWDQFEARYISPDPPWAIGAAQKENSHTVRCTIIDGNGVPSISYIPHQLVGLGGSLPTTAFTVGDLETAASSLIVTATSSDQNIIRDEDILLGGSDENRTIELSTTGTEGNAAITIYVDDGTDSAVETFIVMAHDVLACPGTRVLGEPCMLDGDEIVYVGEYDPLDGGGERPLYAQHCDQDMIWDGSQCTGTSTEFPWNNGNTTGYTDTTLDSSSYVDGQENTDVLVAEDSDSDVLLVQPHQAAQSCRDIGAEWFLPARYELSVLFEVRNEGELYESFAISGSDNRYWSSSESASEITMALYIRFQDSGSGSAFSAGKSGLLSVRCVRR